MFCSCCTEKPLFTPGIKHGYLTHHVNDLSIISPSCSIPCSFIPSANPFITGTSPTLTLHPFLPHSSFSLALYRAIYYFSALLASLPACSIVCSIMCSIMHSIILIVASLALVPLPLIASFSLLHAPLATCFSYSFFSPFLYHLLFSPVLFHCFHSLLTLLISAPLSRVCSLLLLLLVCL